MTILKEGIVVRRVRVAKDYGLLKLVYKQFGFWLVNVYMTPGSKAQIQKLFRAIDRFIPKEELKTLFITGDFNVDLEKSSDELDLLCNLAKELGLSIFKPDRCTRLNATLDYSIAYKSLDLQIAVNESDLSDHRVIVTTIPIRKFRRPPNLRVVNKKLAVKATESALSKSNNAKKFLDNIHQFRRRNKKQVNIILNRRQVTRKLFLALVKDQEDDTRTVLNRYWKDLIGENENLRYSVDSREAFRFLGRVFKYNQFEKRDGAIANSVQVEGRIVDEENEVNRLIMDSLRRTQLDPRFPCYSGLLPFPNLGIPSEEELEFLLNRLWPGKAITGDCISDDIFSKDKADVVKNILRDL